MTDLCFTLPQTKLVAMMNMLSGVGLDEVLLKTSKEGLINKEKDSNHVCLQSLIFRDQYFEDYVFEKEGFEIGLDISYLKRILNLFSISDIIEVSVDVEHIELCNGDRTVSISMNNVKISCHPDIRIPSLIFDCSYEVDSSDILNVLCIIDEIKQFDYDKVMIVSDDGKLSVFAKFDLFSFTKSICAKNLSGDKDETHSKFPLRNLLKIFRSCKGEFDLFLADDYPVKIIQDSTEFRAEYFLAPIIEEGGQQ